MVVAQVLVMVVWCGGIFSACVYAALEREHPVIRMAKAIWRVVDDFYFVHFTKARGWKARGAHWAWDFYKSYEK